MRRLVGVRRLPPLRRRPLAAVPRPAVWLRLSCVVEGLRRPAPLPHRGVAPPPGVEPRPGKQLYGNDLEYLGELVEGVIHA